MRYLRLPFRIVCPGPLTSMLSFCLVAMSWSWSGTSLAQQVTGGEEVTYRKHIQPLWAERCASCHGSDAPYYGEFRESKDEFVAQDIGPRMDTYADLIYFIGWPDTGAIMRRLDDGKLTADGKPGNMYEYLGDDEEERQRNLALFKAWVGPNAWKLNRWKTRDDVPGITKEELDQLLLKY